MLKEPIDFYFFRHGETDWNREKRFQGHTDIPLNERGLEQAEAVAPLIEKLNVDLLLSSDLKRALTTAEIVNKKINPPVRILTSPLLREADLGEAEGKIRDEVLALYGDQAWQRWISSDPLDLEFAYPKGETKREHLQRLLEGLTHFARRETSAKKIAVSSHGGSMRRILQNSGAKEKEIEPVSNCSVYWIKYFSESDAWVFQAKLG